jgi:hypothetical protein
MEGNEGQGGKGKDGKEELTSCAILYNRGVIFHMNAAVKTGLTRRRCFQALRSGVSDKFKSIKGN